MNIRPFPQIEIHVSDWRDLIAIWHKRHPGAREIGTKKESPKQ